MFWNSSQQLQVNNQMWICSNLVNNQGNPYKLGHLLVTVTVAKVFLNPARCESQGVPADSQLGLDAWSKIKGKQKQKKRTKRKRRHSSVIRICVTLEEC